MGEISGTYKSESGSYDPNIRALVYIDGSYAGDADLLPRTPPGLGEEDPGQSFSYDLLARNLNGYEVEFIIINGDETASTRTRISVSASPLSSNLEYIKALYLGLFDREPHSSEYKRYFYKLEDGSMTRELVLKDFCERAEFIKARNGLLAYKTVNGSWAETDTVLSATDQEGYGMNGNQTEGQMGGENSNPSNGTNTHGSTEDTATIITMNEPSIGITFDEPADVNGFKIYSLGDRQDGVFTVTLTKNGIASLFNTDTRPEDITRPAWNAGILLRARLNDGTYENIPHLTSEHLQLGDVDFRDQIITFDLRSQTGVNYYYFEVLGDYTAPYELGTINMTLSNDLALAAENAQADEEDGTEFESIDSKVNGYDLQAALTYQVNAFHLDQVWSDRNAQS